MILRVLALVVAGAVLCAGCSDVDSVEEVSLEELVDVVGCTNPRPIDPLRPPIRSRSASDGMTCTVNGEAVDIYERAPVDGTEGGTLERIDSDVGTGNTRERCEGWVLTGETWFIVTTSKETLDAAAERLDSVVRPVQPAMPDASYLLGPVELSCGL